MGVSSYDNIDDSLSISHSKERGVSRLSTASTPTCFWSFFSCGLGGARQPSPCCLSDWPEPPCELAPEEEERAVLDSGERGGGEGEKGGGEGEKGGGERREGERERGVGVRERGVRGGGRKR